MLRRADQRSFTREPIDLSLLVHEATETLLPLAEKRGVALEISGDIAPAFGSQALLLLTTNLLHNGSSTTCRRRARCGSRAEQAPRAWC